MDVWYKYPDQEKVVKAFLSQLEEVSHSQAPVFTRDFDHLNRSSQHGFVEGKLCQTDLIYLYKEMMTLVDEGRAVMWGCET